jgi:hypothetical protein
MSEIKKTSLVTGFLFFFLLYANLARKEYIGESTNY